MWMCLTLADTNLVGCLSAGTVYKSNALLTVHFILIPFPKYYMFMNTTCKNKNF